MDDFDETPEPPAAVEVPARAAADDDFWGDGPEAAEPVERRATRGRRSWRTWLVAGAGAALIGGAAVAGIGATSSDNSLASAAAGTNNGASANGGANGAPPGANGSPPGAFGTVSGIDGSTITVKDASGQTTKVVTSSSTTVTKTTTVTASDVAVGDHLVVSGSGSSSKVAATQVHDDGAGSGVATGGPGAGGPGGNAGNGSFVAGTVGAVDGSTFTVKDANGDTVTVTTSSATKFTKDTDAKVSDLAVGDSVMVVGTTANGTVDATRIRDGVPAGAGGGPGGPGPESGSSQ